MSVHSAMSRENPNFTNSHHNNPSPSMEAHSVLAQVPTINPEQQQWVAAYIDGQYYLTDPESMRRLRNIEDEIQKERSKLANLEDRSLCNSFLSLQEDKHQKQSNKSFCNTEFNENLHITKKQKVKDELEKEEDKYKEKIKKMEKQRNDMKKVMKPPSKQHSEAKGQELIKEQPNLEKKSEVKQNIKEENPKEAESPVEKSKKSARKSVRASSKDKSFHKSRIQQSIKDNLEIQNNSNVIAAVQPSEKREPSVKVSNKNQIQTSKNPKQEDEKLQEKSSRVVSEKPGSHIGSQKKESVKNSNYKVEINPVGSVRSSQIEPPSLKKPTQQASLKKSQKVQTQSKKEQHEEVKSQKINRQNQEETFSKKTRTVKQDEIKSKKQYLVPDDTKSRHSNILNVQETKSKKSGLNQEIENKKLKTEEKIETTSNRLAVEEVISKKSSEIIPPEDEDIKSKHSSRVSKPQESDKKSSRARSIKKESSRVEEQDRKSRKSDVIEDKGSHKSYSKKSQVQKKELIDKQIQYSRVTDQNKESNINSIKFQNFSEKNSSSIPPNQQSQVNASTLNMMNKELAQQQVQKLEGSHIISEYNMKKKKEETIPENQSEKKSRSFIIHSRNGSVKERTEKSYDKLKRSKLSEKKSQLAEKKSQMESQAQPPSYVDSVSREEIYKLHKHIEYLKQKLRDVQERQMHLEKMEENHSKITSKPETPSEKQKEEKQEEIQQSPPQTSENPFVQLSEISLGLRPQAKLQLQSSIIQVNTTEEKILKMQKQSQAEQKVKLLGEISRLKKIIRDMQIQKIKSIDPDNESELSPLLRKDSKQLAYKDSRVERQKESILQVEDMPTQKKFWGKSRIQDVGKIIKNSNIQYQKQELSPRRRSQQIKVYGAEQEILAEDLPYQSSQKSPSKLIRGAKHASMIDQLQEKDKDFHHFIESSRILVEDSGKRQPTELGLQTNTKSFQGFSKFANTGFAQPSNKINYSRMVQEFKKHNPEEDQILPEINLKDIKIPEIPNTPTSDMNQDDLLNLAKQTYLGFGIDVDGEDKQLSVKKYKNCVVFTITNNTSECILWHFSGKFYMGGWRSGQPGEGQKNGQGLQIVPEKYVYKGQFLNGKKNGTGILKLVNGNIYDGQWIDGLKNGRGVYLDTATRVVYSGQWKQGKKDGQGYLKLSDKQYYYGTFVRSIKQGFGVEIFLNGDKYKGEYKNGKFHGKGKYTWSNGSCYEGQFQEGVRQGQGSWKSAKTNGDIYIGTYEADKKNGYGRYVWANGCTYEGGFYNDVKHGKGRLTYQDGKEIKGVWEQGNLMKTQNEKAVPGDHQEQPLRRSVKVNSFGGYHPATRTRF